MRSLQFWKSWNTPNRTIFSILSLLIFSAIVFFWWGWSASPAPTVTYDHFQQIQRIEVPSHSFQVGLINLHIPADSYVIFENIFGSKLQPNRLALSIFLGAFAVSFLIFVSIVSTPQPLLVFDRNGISDTDVGKSPLRCLECFWYSQ